MNIFIAGHTYQLHSDNLKRYPALIFHHQTHMKQFYDSHRQAYCLTRNRAFFELLLFYINHGILSKPNDLPMVSDCRRRSKRNSLYSILGSVPRRIEVSELIIPRLNRSYSVTIFPIGSISMN